MKTIAKFMLVLVFFGTVPAIVLADGEQGTGARCTVDCPPDPNPTPTGGSGNSMTDGGETLPMGGINSTNVETSELSGNSRDFSLLDWLYSLFG